MKRFYRIFWPVHYVACFAIAIVVILPFLNHVIQWFQVVFYDAAVPANARTGTLKAFLLLGLAAANLRISEMWSDRKKREPDSSPTVYFMIALAIGLPSIAAYYWLAPFVQAEMAYSYEVLLLQISDPTQVPMLPLP